MGSLPDWPYMCTDMFQNRRSVPSAATGAEMTRPRTLVGLRGRNKSRSGSGGECARMGGAGGRQGLALVRHSPGLPFLPKQLRRVLRAV